jgi:hypothetical protein
MVGPFIYRAILSGGDRAKIGDPAEVLRAVLDGLRPQ